MAEHANYAWVIENDYTEGLGDHDPRYDKKLKRFVHSIPKTFEPSTVEGPRNAHPQALKDLRAGKGQAFQLWDDDGILYYTGRWFETLDDENYDNVREHDWGNGDPLSDYGAPNAGATEMTTGNRQAFIG